MAECLHPFRIRVIDKLEDFETGPMPGEITAKITAWHFVCRICGTTLEEEADAGEQPRAGAPGGS